MKFIHIADVHLGAIPDLGFPWSEDREKEIWESFHQVIGEVKKTNTELLLIAGDLFHGQPLVRELKEISYLFEQIPETMVVLIAGNHDYLKKDSNYLNFAWPPNVVGLWGENCQAVYLEPIHTYVYGLSYESREIRDPLYNQVFPGGRQNLMTEHPKAFHILLGHGGDEKHIPIRFSELGQAGFDYIALGHIHKPEILIPGKMAYAGSLEPLDKNHLGPRGYIRGEIREGETRIEFVPAAKREYVELEISITPEDTGYSVQNKVEKEIEERGSHCIYKILLVGFRDPETEFFPELLEAVGNVVEVRDRSVPDYDFREMQNRYTGTIIGTYLEQFAGRELTEVQRKALYYGVQALLEARE